MPTRTHAQTLALISAINAEINFTYPDQLSYFARRFRDDLQAQVNEAEKLQQQKLNDLIYTYAQTYDNGIIKKEAYPVFNETLKMFIPVQISAPDLATVEAEAEVIITATQSEELSIEPLVCPDCPRIALLSPEFKEAFAGILTPEATYTDEAFNSYDIASDGTDGCFYAVGNPVTVYKDSIAGKYYQFNDRQPSENTYALDGFYFTSTDTYYQITNGVLNEDAFSCYEG